MRDLHATRSEGGIPMFFFLLSVVRENRVPQVGLLSVWKGEIVLPALRGVGGGPGGRGGRGARGGRGGALRAIGERNAQACCVLTRPTSACCHRSTTGPPSSSRVKIPAEAQGPLSPA